MNGGSWLTFAIVAIIVGAGLYFWTHRPGLGRANANGGNVAAEAGEPDLSAEMRFDLGRKKLIEEQFTDAAAIFRTLYEEARLAEPKNSWAGVHVGLSEYFAGRPGAARAAFKMLAERTTPTAIGLDAKLVAFLRKLSELTAGGAKADTANLEAIDPATYESIAYLIAGLKRWDAGDFEEAVSLLRRFQRSTPTGEDAWVADYRPLLTRFLDEFGIYREIADDIAKADGSPKVAEAALNRIPAARDRVRSANLRKKLAAIETEAGEKVRAAIAAADQVMKQQKAEDDAREDALLTAAKLQLKALCEDYRYSEAASVIRAVAVKSDRGMAERELLTRRVEWLVDFKKRLVEDINGGGCTAPLMKKNGQNLLGTASRADDQQIEVRVQFGTLPAVKWSDISPLSVLRMARVFMRPTLPQPALADREWQASVFCLFTQLSAEGQALMDDAVARKPAYQNDRALFFGQAVPSPGGGGAPAPTTQ